MTSNGFKDLKNFKHLEIHSLHSLFWGGQC